MTRYLSVEEFSKRAGKSTETIRRHLRNNKYPGAFKKSDTSGWKIPETYLAPSGQMEMGLPEDNAEMLDEKPIQNELPSFTSLEEVERLISLAYQIAFLCEPSDTVLHRLKVCGVERALEIILVMRQSPKQPIKNPEGFVQKAVVCGWKPNGLHGVKGNEQQQTVSGKASAAFTVPGKLYDWLDGG